MEGYIQALIDMHTREYDNNTGTIAEMHRNFAEELKDLLEYIYILEERKEK